jgi:hypothetical protein
MVRRHEIQVLRRARRSLVETAKQVGVSQSSVQRVEAEPPVTNFDTDDERRKRGIGQPSKAEPHRTFLIGELAAQPDVMALELLRRARIQGYAGGKSALYELVKELRPERIRPVVRFEGLAGEFSQHDFGHVDVHFIDGRRQRVHFFASRLKYSRWVQVSLVENEARRGTGARHGRSLRRMGWPATARGVRSPQDDRSQVDEGRQSHRVESDLRRGRA